MTARERAVKEDQFRRLNQVLSDIDGGRWRRMSFGDPCDPGSGGCAMGLWGRASGVPYYVHFSWAGYKNHLEFAQLLGYKSPAHAMLSNDFPGGKWRLRRRVGRAMIALAAELWPAVEEVTTEPEKTYADVHERVLAA